MSEKLVGLTSISPELPPGVEGLSRTAVFTGGTEHTTPRPELLAIQRYPDLRDRLVIYFKAGPYGDRSAGVVVRKIHHSAICSRFGSPPHGLGCEAVRIQPRRISSPRHIKTSPSIYDRPGLETSCVSPNVPL
jgi:hypothetical protein